MTTEPAVVRRVLAADATEIYDHLDEFLAIIEKHAPRHASRIETARDLVFSVRVELETEEDEFRA